MNTYEKIDQLLTDYLKTTAMIKRILLKYKSLPKNNAGYLYGCRARGVFSEFVVRELVNFYTEELYTEE